MKLRVTKDYYDGRLSKVVTRYAEELPSGAGLAMLLHEPGVASITITIADDTIQTMVKHINRADQLKPKNED